MSIYAEVMGDGRRKIKAIEYEVNDHGCWICTSHCLNHWGYPVVYLDGYKRLNRVVLERSLGRKIKEGHGALHKCNNRACINTDHLYEGTSEDNAKDSMETGNHVCVKSHVYTKGVSHWKSKLTETQVLEIRKSNLSVPELGKIYGVVRSCIHAIRKGYTWKHLK